MKNCPLTNQPCAKKKSYHITDIVDGKAISNDFCEDCVVGYLKDNKIGKKPPVPQPPKEMVKTFMEFIGFLQEQVNKDATEGSQTTTVIPIRTGAESEAHSIKCPHCGITLADISKHGRLGCMKCYDFFGDGIKKVLAKMHGGNTKHVGKVPKQWKENQKQKSIEHNKILKVSSHIIKRQLAMKKAIEEEDYEAAATHRDAIKTLVSLNREQNQAEKELVKASDDGDEKAVQEIRNKIAAILDRAASIK